MAMLPTGIIVVPTGTDKTITPIEVKGGVMIGTTDATDTAAGNPITETFPFKDNGVVPGLSAPKESTSANSTSNAKKPFTSGTFAYNQVQFMIRNVATKINNTASNALLIGGQSENLPHENTRNGQIGAKIGHAFRNGHWRPLGKTHSRKMFSTGPASASAAYVLPTDNGSDAVDHAIFVTYKAIPGELAYLDGSPNPIQDQYKAKTG